MELNHLSLTEAAQGIATGRFAAEQLTRACLAAIERLDPKIEAWAWLDPALALEQARASDRLRGSGAALGPLHGVPIGIKDNFNTEGIPTRIGSPIFDGNIPGKNAAAVDKCLEAGAILLGKTVTTEFAFFQPGKTHNPWNPGHTPGGSSSGSAAGVAAAFMPAALGSQTVGSVIRPAAYCGIVGFKPSFGMIPRDGLYPFSQTLDHIGVFTRTVQDAALLVSCLVQHDAEDALNVPAGATQLRSIEAQPSPPRIAAVRSPVWDLADENQRAAFARNIATLRAHGAMIEECELPPAFLQAQGVWQTILRYEATRVFAPVQEAHPGKVSAHIGGLIDEGGRIPESAYRDALDARRCMQGEFESFLKDWDGMITPPATGEAPRTLESTGNPAFCATWTLLGVPAINVPSGWGPTGLPLGLQVVGSYGADAQTLGVARWCEAHLGFERRLVS